MNVSEAKKFVLLCGAAGAVFGAVGFGVGVIIGGVILLAADD